MAIPLRFHPRPWPTALCLAGLSVLLALGFWQLDRLEWKEGLLARIDARMATSAVSLPAGALLLEDWEYRRVVASGRFDHAKEVPVFKIGAKGGAGFDLYVPLIQDGAAGVLWVNRGWVREGVFDDDPEAIARPAGNATLEGVVRGPWRPGPFAPDNDPAADRWFWPELAAMDQARSIKTRAFVVHALPGPGGERWPRADRPGVNIRNDHLSYAITWFTLAGALVVIYLLAHLKRRE